MQKSSNFWPGEVQDVLAVSEESLHFSANIHTDLLGLIYTRTTVADARASALNLQPVLADHYLDEIRKLVAGGRESVS